MERVYSIEEKVRLIVEEFFDDIKAKEPFYSCLDDYSFRLKAKLSELLTQLMPDYESANRSFDSALLGIYTYLEKRINVANLEDRKELERLIKALEETNRVLMSFMYDERIKDKGTLSKVAGSIRDWAEALSVEFKRKFSSFWTKLKSLFGKR